MKSFIILLIILSSFAVHAGENELGLGVMIGNPTGLNGKYWLKDNTAVDGGFAFSLGKKTRLSIHSDYLLHKNGAFFFNDVHPLDLYFGIGGRMEFDEDIEVGVRVPVGLAHRFTEQPADMFAEIAPIVDFIGRTGLEIHIAVGARYYFQ
jgi:hypothetical protein